MGKSAERCPRCGSHVPVVKTDTVPALPDENYKGNRIGAMRYQRLRCPVCGRRGDRMVLLGKTRWEGMESD